MSEERIDGAAKARLDQAIGSMQDAYGKALDQADEALDGLQGHAEALVGDLQAQVREKPLLSVGIAMMAGALLWQLIGGGRKIIYVRK